MRRRWCGTLKGRIFGLGRIRWSLSISTAGAIIRQSDIQWSKQISSIPAYCESHVHDEPHDSKMHRQWKVRLFDFKTVASYSEDIRLHEYMRYHASRKETFAVCWGGASSCHSTWLLMMTEKGTEGGTNVPATSPTYIKWVRSRDWISCRCH